MRKEIKTVVYDDELRLEAYCFEGVVQPFPNHFHEYYVIGFVEGGERCLSCRNQEYTIGKGNVILFNPGDSHACIQTDDGTLDYRGFNITKEVMLDLAEEVTGKRELPGFSQNVICDEEITCYLRPLHGILFMIPALFLFDFELDLSRFANMTYLLNILFLGLGASALCFVTWNFAVKILGAVKTSICIYLVPVITVAASVLIIHEPFTWITGIGTILTLAGLLISEKKHIRKEVESNGFTE